MLSFSIARQTRHTFACVAVLALCAPVCAAEKRRGKDPAGKEPDLAIQGEYEGQLSGEDGRDVKFGVQVIARGNGTFNAIGLRGGLPGAGWDRSPRIQANGKTRGGATEFAEFFGGATIRDGILTIRGKDGKTIGTLRRITRKSPTLGAKPPAGAIVLFDGKVNDFKPGTVTADRLLVFGQTSQHSFSRDFRLHLEFRTPFKPRAWGQGRGNSGVYLQRKYEIQVLDTFGQKEDKSHCGGIYGRLDPDINMCFPPGSWQTYDVEFKVARFGDDGEVLSSPRLTLRHNGVVVHDNVELKPRNARDKPPKAGPLHLQRHDPEPVHYRNIWVVE
jgi:hypothetical protein